MSLDRNSPCPCGSGRKYKRCCLRRDFDAARALHLIGAEPPAPGEMPGGLRYPAGPVWQADIVPISATFDDDNGARPVVALVCGNGFVLHANVLGAGPSEPADVARAIATAVEHARARSLDAPRVIEVRFEAVGNALAAQLGRELEVRVLPRLDGVDDAAFNLHKNVMGDGDPRLQTSSPATWKAWALGDDRVRRNFAAAAAYHRAAPWKYAADDATIEATVPGGGTWYLAILGGAGETFGLAAYASLEDLKDLLGGGKGREGDHLMRLSAAVVSLTFGPSKNVPRAMRQEIRSARWEVAGEFAYPLLMVLNTPAGGITTRQADDLVALLRDVPSFVIAKAGVGDSPARSASGEATTRFVSVPLGDAEAPLWPAPTVLSPAMCRGPGAKPFAVLAVGESEDQALDAQDALFKRFGDWLGRPVGGKFPADSTIKRHMRPAVVFAEFMIYVHGAKLCAVSEFDLRVFLYDDALRRDIFGELALDQLRGSLRRFFAFLAEYEGIECPWATSILDDADAFALRRATLGAARASGAEEDWRRELTDDLVARVLLPERVTPDGTTWGPAFTPATFALFRELMRRWLVWRDEAIASGQSTPDAVSSAAVREQLEWQRRVHPRLGISPADALARPEVVR